METKRSSSMFDRTLLLPAGGSTLFAAMIIVAHAAIAGQTSANQSRGVFPDAVTPVLQTGNGKELTGTPENAPQILGVIATHGPVPLTCSDRGCSADLSSFCLQQARDNPQRGQSYVLAGGSDLALSGLDSAGQRKQVPAWPYLTIISDRGFTAVEMMIPPEKVAALGLNDLAVEIGDKVSLLPAAMAHEHDPQTAAEIELATGRSREAGAAFFDQSGKESDAIRLANLMINVLPRQGRSVGDAESHVLEAAMASQAGRASTREGLEFVREIYASCQQRVSMPDSKPHPIYNMRSCLEAQHDRLVMRRNSEFWASGDGY
jgi:hypothetical protein